MKGLTHFAAGVAAASFFPAAVEAAARGNPLYFVLGGVFGILPDTLDFKLYRFFVRHEMEVAPDPNRPDPQMIADAVAYAIHRAHLGGRPVRIKLDTIPVGLDSWQQYAVEFDVRGQRVLARYGPVVNTGQMPLPGSVPPVSAEGESRLACPLTLDYEAVHTVDILDGPTFRMEPTREGTVCPRFIPWHREWSHSLVTAAAMGLAGAGLLDAMAGAIIFLASAAHIAADQLGFMGSALGFPLTRRRTPGLGLTHSGRALPNFALVWLSALAIFWNLYRALPADAAVLRFNLVQLLLAAGVAPVALFLGLDRILKGRDRRGAGPG